MPEEDPGLRQSFGSIADGYDRFRSGPPDEAVQWALGPQAEEVLEIGAGTGGLTRRLVGRPSHVRAVEPDARMRAVLRERVPAVEVVAGSGEQIPAAGASFDAVIGASMWHWVDEARALPEVARVLRPGGKELNGDEFDGMDARRRARHVVHLGPEDPFAAPERQVIRWTRLMTKEDLVEVPMRCVCWRTTRR